MNVGDFDYQLPEELIAQKPIEPRDSCRLMIVHRKSGDIQHDYFYNLGKYLIHGDLLVFNNSKVIPARLYGQKDTGGKIEVLLLKYNDGYWEYIGNGIGRAKILKFDRGLNAELVGDNKLKFNFDYEQVMNILEEIGNTPLPPYIKRNSEKSDKNDYQTVYAKVPGSAAAPTAGLHFTDELISHLNEQGIENTEVTLHVGLGTFLPMKSEKIEDHKMHSEWYEVPKSTSNKIIKAKENNQRIIAVGTTSVRTLESWFVSQKAQDETKIFIYPGYEFKIIDGLITNFHLPKSTLLLMVSAMAGRELIFKAYQEAINMKYRFFSYGDAMLIL